MAGELPREPSGFNFDLLVSAAHGSAALGRGRAGLHLAAGRGSPESSVSAGEGALAWPSHSVEAMAFASLWELVVLVAELAVAVRASNASDRRRLYHLVGSCYYTCGSDSNGNVMSCDGWYTEWGYSCAHSRDTRGCDCYGCTYCSPAPSPTPRPTPHPTPHPTREPTSYPTQFKFQSGWCSSTLDEYAGDASNVQECWDKCWDAHGSSLMAVDLDLDNECYCQDDCQCLDLGHGGGYFIATDRDITELPGMCGGCSDVCTEGLYKGECVGFTREAKGKWGDWTLPEYEGIACSKDQCCAANEDECCELNVGMIAGVAVAIFVVVAGCIGVCCFLGCKKRKQETGKPPSLPLVGDAREPPPPALVPIPEHKKQRRFPEPSAPPPPSLAPIKAQAAGMLTEETPPQPSVPVAEPVQSTSSVGWGARSLQRLASWRAPAPETSEMEPEPEVPAAEPVPSSEGWGARGLQRLASWRAPAAAPPPITLGGKKVDVAQEELCSPRRVDMVHASVAKWYNSTGKGAALRTRFGPFPATPEALNKWYARNKVMTAFLDDQGVPPEF